MKLLFLLLFHLAGILAGAPSFAQTGGGANGGKGAETPWEAAEMQSTNLWETGQSDLGRNCQSRMSLMKH